MPSSLTDMHIFGVQCFIITIYIFSSKGLLISTIYGFHELQLPTLKQIIEGGISEDFNKELAS